MQTGESTTTEFGVKPFAKRGRVDIGFERGAGLAQRVDRAVELAGAVIAPADHRAHRAVEIGDHDRRLAGADSRGRIARSADFDLAFGVALQIRMSSAVRTTKKLSVTDFGNVSTSLRISSNAQSR